MSKPILRAQTSVSPQHSDFDAISEVEVKRGLTHSEAQKYSPVERRPARCRCRAYHSSERRKAELCAWQGGVQLKHRRCLEVEGIFSRFVD
jgi:hypothetical protein